MKRSNPKHFFIILALVLSQATMAKDKLKAEVLNSPVKESHLKVQLTGEETISKIFFKPQNGGEEVEGELIKSGSTLSAHFKVSQLAPGTFEYRIRALFQAGKSKKNTASSIAFVKFEIDPSLEVADPGEEGKKTLLGIDSDNDGVRDDVQRWINETYPKSASENVNKALKQTARGLQASILNSEDKVKAVKSLDEFQAGVFCLLGHLGEESYRTPVDRVKNLVLNTIERTKSYLLSNHFSHGTGGRLPNTKEEELAYCK